MAAMLTFYPRRGLLEATASGQAFLVPVYRDHTRVLAWEKMQELRPGKATLWDHSFELPGDRLERGGDAVHWHTGAALHVGTHGRGIHVHGLPVCNRGTCIIVLQRWDDLRRAIAGERRLSFSISP